MTHIKICGLTQAADIIAAAHCGADILGFIHVPKSQRYVPVARLNSLLQTVPVGIKRVIVVQDASREHLDHLTHNLAFDYFQFHGNESTELVAHYPGYKVVHIRHNHLDPMAIKPFPGLVMLDTQWGHQKGGSGRTFNWSVLRDLNQPFLVAGGLHPENVAELVGEFQPWGVDVSSGVEHAPGEKDHRAIAKFISQVRSVEAS